jgi:uncharacterized damage-inducible protein DinB
MSWVEHVRQKIAYNEWANEKVFVAAASVDDAQLNAERPGTSYGSLARDLSHLVRVQGWWHSVAADTTFEPEDEPASEVMAALRRQLDTSNASLRELATSLTEASLDSPRERSRDGETHTWSQWQVIEHLLNHSTHHRAETGQVLYGLGASPGDMDFLFYL